MVNTEKFISQTIMEIKTAAGSDKVVMALSGGVDSSVCAALAAKAIGDNLIPIYIDTGLMRKGETERIRTIFGNIHLQIVDAGEEFFDSLKGVTDPESKRKAIGERFIRVFEREARKQGARCLLQGTIYPDRIESEGGIKSHHNVGGMPLEMEFTTGINLNDRRSMTQLYAHAALVGGLKRAMVHVGMLGRYTTAVVTDRIPDSIRIVLANAIIASPLAVGPGLDGVH